MRRTQIRPSKPETKPYWLPTEKLILMQNLVQGLTMPEALNSEPVRKPSRPPRRNLVGE